jgi:hypothetical protein
MAADKRQIIVENLALASAIGFLALVVAAVSLAADSSSVAAERSSFAAGGAAALALRVDDPSFDRLFSIQADSGLSYGSILAFRSPRGSALVRAVFTPRGELTEIRLLGSCSSRLPKDLAGEFPGASETLARAAESVRRISRTPPEAGS